MGLLALFRLQFKPVTWIILASAMVLGLLLASLMLPLRFTYDEIYYVDKLFRELSASNNKIHFLLHDWWVPPGPLHLIFQYPLYCLIGGSPLAARLVNFSLFVSMVGMLAAILRATGVEQYKSWFAGASVLAIPATWVFAGLALTEIPAMTVLVFSLGLLLSQLRRESRQEPPLRRDWKETARVIAAGLSMGLAIVGRQPYLVILPFVIAGMLLQRCRRSTVITFVLSIIPVPATWFFLWGGLVSPMARYAGSGIRWEHGVLSICYLGIYMALLSPWWLLRVPWKLVMPAAIGAAAMNLGLLGLKRPLAESIFVRLGEEHMPRTAWEILGGTACVAMAAVTAICFAFHCWNNRQDYIYLACSGAGVAMAGAAAGISHLFSSRYPAMALPFLIALSMRHREWNALEYVATLIGAALGAMVLWSYHSV